MQVILSWVLSFRGCACTRAPVHTGLCLWVAPAGPSMDTEEILPSHFPGTELGVTWLADRQLQWKECNPTPPTSSPSAPRPASKLAQLWEKHPACGVKRSFCISVRSKWISLGVGGNVSLLDFCQIFLCEEPKMSCYKNRKRTEKRTESESQGMSKTRAETINQINHD